MSDDALRDDLRSAIADWYDTQGDAVDDRTSLISSGRLDSVNLLRLLLWVEQEIGQPIDATRVDLATEWDTIDGIVAYVERYRSALEH